MKFQKTGHLSRAGSGQGDPTPLVSVENLLVRPHSSREILKHFLARRAGRAMTRELP